MSWHIAPAGAFATLAGEWDALQRAATDTPFLESAFLAPLLDTFGCGQERVALHRGPAGIDAAALLRPNGPGRWETFQPSQLPLGPWVAPSASPEQRARSLLPALPGLALELGITQLDPRLAERPRDGGTVAVQDYVDTSYLDIAGSFDDYWNARGKNLRQNVRKQRAKLDADGVTVRLECIDRPADVAAALRDYEALERSGWKAEAGTAVDSEGDQGRFYRRMLQNFCALERGRIYRYRFGEQVVAMDLCIDNGPLVVILKTAYDASHRQISPSTLMRQEQFRLWWSEGRYRRIEFYGKTLEWHTRWTTSSRRLYHLTVYRWPFLRKLRPKARA